MDRHSFFLADWHTNERAISARIQGDWRVRCGHCGVSLGGCLGHGGPTTEIEWRHDQQRDMFFGTFAIREPIENL